MDENEPAPFQAKPSGNNAAKVWSEISNEVSKNGEYEDNGEKTPKKFRSTHDSQQYQAREKKEKEIILEDQFNDDINKEKPEVVDNDPVSHVEKKRLPEPKRAIIDEEETNTFQASEHEKNAQKAWNNITREVRIEGEYDDVGDVVPKELRHSHPSPKPQAYEKKQRKIPEIEDDFNDDINKEKPEVVDEDPVSHVQKKKLPTPQPVIIEEHEKNNFKPTEHEKKAQSAWTNITREVRIDGEYDDVGDVVPKELRHSHPSPRPPTHEKKQRPIPEIEDEFNDDINKVKEENPEEEESVSYVQKKSLAAPQPVIIHEEEKNTFKPTENEKKAQSAWTNITREVRIDGEYDDVGDVVSKSLRHSHPSPRPPTHEKKQRPIPEIEDEFNDDINKIKEENPEEEESVSYVQKKKLAAPQPVIIHEEEKNQFKPTEHEKKAQSAWTNISREIKMDGEYDDVGDVVPKSLRHSHQSPRPPTHEKKQRPIPEIEDEFNDDLNKEKPEAVDEDPVSHVPKKHLQEPKPVIIEEDENNTFKATQNEKKAQSAWTNITREVRIDGEYDDVGDVVPKELRHSHPSPRPPTHEKKQRPIPEIEDEFNDDINKVKEENPEEEESVSYVQKKSLAAPQPVIIHEEEKNTFKPTENEKKAQSAWTNITREVRIDGEYDDVGDVVPKSLRHSHPSPRPPTHEKKQRPIPEIEDKFNDDINKEKPEVVDNDPVSHVPKKRLQEPKPVVIEEDEKSPFQKKNNANQEKARNAWNNISREIRIEGEYNDEYDYENNTPKSMKSTHKHPVYIPKGFKKNDAEEEDNIEQIKAPGPRPKSTPINNADVMNDELTEEEMNNIAATVTCRGLDPDMITENSISDFAAPQKVCKECHMVRLDPNDEPPMLTDAQREAKRKEQKERLLKEIKEGKVDAKRLEQERLEQEEDRRKRVQAIKAKMAKRGGNVKATPQQKEAAMKVSKALQEACSLLMSRQQV
ncbi:hypothetical protein TVAG_158900 [Trichomonas vaginalis G3]|uniref:Uncharacterized protein n=1 Tax=Trichomonas vaginalis (strain ATCC PRA-98 / G3) TaxID=412133 RepID=A2E6R9_TRIV3|nr:hypothetical protein TVAGG3_0779280 [Trichomonas vaginalis G3]EAY11663.1 hypothetical protein TVAG_158900 [Trichomonas vaginalis G3]KAI5494932.1 hypothetical protein TVAGG3_0779280 [Trichomonas vaginalis G3]|eukprot:XP_001323886.1 hypothetical protein [Trichomonas vaginalis G3]